MAIRRMDHVGIVVDDLAAAVAFFVELGLEERGDGSVKGDAVDRIVGLDGVDCDFAMLKMPVDFGNVYRLGYLRGPAGIIVELAEKL
jgi:hypothetical protein